MAEQGDSSPLVAHLLSIHKGVLSSATQHPFLSRAGKGTLPAPALCRWLVQDKYYQLAYVNFIGGLISKLDLSSIVLPQQSSDEGKNLSWRTLNILVDALGNIRQEISFYDKTAKKYSLELQEAPPNETTEEYIDLFNEVGRGDTSLLHGLVVLWATEYCYHSAWTYASSEAARTPAQSQTPTVSEHGPSAALHREFIPNWTSEAFRDFVEALAALVNDTWASELEAKSWEPFEGLWLRVLELESKFWPEA